MDGIVEQFNRQAQARETWAHDVPAEGAQMPHGRLRDMPTAGAIDELLAAIAQLTEAIVRLTDYFQMDAWDRQYGRNFANRAQPSEVRPASPIGQEPLDETLP